jgi:hypothetical protein
VEKRRGGSWGNGVVNSQPRAMRTLATRLARPWVWKNAQLLCFLGARLKASWVACWSLIKGSVQSTKQA